MSFDTIIEMEDLARFYEMGGVTIKALDGVDLQIGRGEYVSIVGPSGSGKTTLFNMIGGLDRPTRGRVYIDGVDISKLDAYELAWLRCRKIGYIFQTFNLIPVLTAVENVSLPTVFAGIPRNEGLEKAEKLLASVGLGERLQHRPTELSAGQQQRVAIARAMANDPAIILADEPTGNLNSKEGREIMEMLKELNDAGTTIVQVTHSELNAGYGRRTIHLLDGWIEGVWQANHPAGGGAAAGAAKVEKLT